MTKTRDEGPQPDVDRRGPRLLPQRAPPVQLRREW
jgi:hypothetical protein